MSLKLLINRVPNSQQKGSPKKISFSCSFKRFRQQKTARHFKALVCFRVEAKSALKVAKYQRHRKKTDQALLKWASLAIFIPRRKNNKTTETWLFKGQLVDWS